MTNEKITNIKDFKSFMKEKWSHLIIREKYWEKGDRKNAEVSLSTITIKAIEDITDYKDCKESFRVNMSIPYENDPINPITVYRTRVFPRIAAEHGFQIRYITYDINDRIFERMGAYPPDKKGIFYLEKRLINPFPESLSKNIKKMILLKQGIRITFKDPFQEYLEQVRENIKRLEEETLKNKK